MGMTTCRKLYEGFMAAATAHARWDYETSMSILKSRKKLFILGLMILPVVLVSIAFAVDLPAILGGKKAYSPAFYNPTTVSYTHLTLPTN